MKDWLQALARRLAEAMAMMTTGSASAVLPHARRLPAVYLDEDRFRSHRLVTSAGDGVLLSWPLREGIRPTTAQYGTDRRVQRMHGPLVDQTTKRSASFKRALGPWHTAERWLRIVAPPEAARAIEREVERLANARRYYLVENDAELCFLLIDSYTDFITVGLCVTGTIVGGVALPSRAEDRLFDMATGYSGYRAAGGAMTLRAMGVRTWQVPEGHPPSLMTALATSAVEDGKVADES